MRDRYRHLFARRRPPSSPEQDVIPPSLEREVQTAFPRAAVSDELRTRVTQICREAVEAVPPERRPFAWNRRGWMRIARWGTLAVAAAALAVIWRGDRPTRQVLAEHGLTEIEWRAMKRASARKASA